jgi:hypothetical protein
MLRSREPRIWSSGLSSEGEATKHPAIPAANPILDAAPLLKHLLDETPMQCLFPVSDQATRDRVVFVVILDPVDGQRAAIAVSLGNGRNCGEHEIVSPEK